MKEKFRVWDKIGMKMCTVWSILFYDDLILVDIYGLGDRKEDTLELGKECALIRYTGLRDKNGEEGWEGDLRKYHGKIYKVVDESWRFVLERNLVEFGENEDITIGEDVMFESELIGTIFKNPELLKE